MEHKFKTHYNAHEFPKLYSINTLPSETVPGMGYTIPEIMKKFASGVNPNVQRPMYFDNDFEHATFDDIDPTLDPNFDFGEAHLQLLEMEEKLREAQAAQVPEKQPVTVETTPLQAESTN